jgi:hypothetical protein
MSNIALPANARLYTAAVDSVGRGWSTCGVLRLVEKRGPLLVYFDPSLTQKLSASKLRCGDG